MIDHRNRTQSGIHPIDRVIPFSALVSHRRVVSVRGFPLERLMLASLAIRLVDENNLSRFEAVDAYVGEAWLWN